MAAFGMPGGAEWLVIAVVVVLLFVPGVVAFLAGYLLGKHAGQQMPAAGEDVSAADRETMHELSAPVGAPLDETPGAPGERDADE